MMNIPTVFKLLITVFSLSIIPAQVHALTPDQVFDKVKDSIVVVKTLDAQGKLKGQGSGVMISTGRVATNCHVVEGGASYQVGRDKQLVRATLYAEDQDKDICLLDAKGITGTSVEIGKAAGLKVGAPVYAVGAPQGLELSLSDGIVAQLRGGPPPLIQTTAAISPGSSGGGLFDGEGRLVGLTTLYLQGGQSLNFAMPAEWIGEIKPGRKTIGKDFGQTEWMKRSFALGESKNWDGLLEWCLKWTKSKPKDFFAWAILGDAYAHLERYNDAIDAYRWALRFDPEYAEAWNNLGIAYNRLQRHNDAIDAYRKALRIKPEYVDAWYNLGIAYGDLQRHNDAIDAYRKALLIDPENAVTWYNLGNNYAGLQRYKDAIEAYRQALRINPKYAWAWYNLGSSYGKLQRHNDAIDAYRQALRIKPEYADAWYNLAISYINSGNRSAALDVVKTLRSLDPKSADELFNMIMPR